MGEAKSRETLSENRYRPRTEKMILQGGFIYRTGSDLLFSVEWNKIRRSSDAKEIGSDFDAKRFRLCENINIGMFTFEI